MMMTFRGWQTAILVAVCCSSAAEATERSELLELRNTVVNLLDALVERGVMTREQAQTMVSTAQERAAAQVSAESAQDSAEQDAVRVTYVPQVVKDEITAAVRADVRPLVVDDVIEKARAERWGIADALPEWTRRVSLSGDVRVRSAGAMYSEDNLPNSYLDFQAINSAGGIGRAGVNALLNTTEDRYAFQGRARFGVRAAITDNVDAFFGIATGNLSVPVSTNQTTGNYFNRWTIGVDRAGIEWRFSPTDRQALQLLGGRFDNPFAAGASSELIWDQDLVFEGIAGRYDIDFGDSRGGQVEPNLFFTVGAFPLDEVAISSDDKWLYGAQIGSELRLGERTRLTASVSYYDYANVTGVRNAPDSELNDFTAPAFVQKGNTMFDIRNDRDPSTNLFALASDYDILALHVGLSFPLAGYIGHGWAEYAKNIGFDSEEILARTGSVVDERSEAYELGFGLESSADWRSSAGGWRAVAMYRYLQRDAVLDAFTDSDFHLGGTDATGWTMSLDYAIARKLWARLRYLSANEIDGPPLGIDVLLLDLNAAF